MSSFNAVPGVKHTGIVIFYWLIDIVLFLFFPTFVFQITCRLPCWPWQRCFHWRWQFHWWYLYIGYKKRNKFKIIATKVNIWCDFPHLLHIWNIICRSTWSFWRKSWCCPLTSSTSCPRMHQPWSRTIHSWGCQLSTTMVWLNYGLVHVF